jgi:hypothetical protein
MLWQEPGGRFIPKGRGKIQPTKTKVNSVSRKRGKMPFCGDGNIVKED